MEYCEECGAVMKEVGVIESTLLLSCAECLAEKRKFLSNNSCEHEFNIKNECAHCGTPK